MDLKALLREDREGNRMDGSLLKGCVDMFRASGDGEWRDAVLHAVSACVFPEEKLKERESITETVCRGKALFFAWDETGEERYKTAAGKLRDALRDSSFSTPRDLYATQPFIAEYDTRFGDKQSYKTIAREFIIACREYQNDDPFLLMALVDTAEKMDMQIYEHYRTLADLFLDRARGISSRETAKEPDAAADAMAAYALLKGVRLGLIDEEKYLPMALRMATALKTACGAAAGDCAGWRVMMGAELKEAEKR